jgi:hypothetical protein
MNASRKVGVNQSSVLEPFDFTAPADIFLRRGKLPGWAPLTYRRFHTAAEAIAYTNEELPARFRASVIMEVQEQRYDHNAIKALGEAVPAVVRPAPLGRRPRRRPEAGSTKP